MPEVITVTKETTVYTLAELEALNWSVYEHAIGKVIEWGWEGFEPSNLTEDLVYHITEDFPLFELQQIREHSSNGKDRFRPHLYWGMNPYTVEFEGDIDIKQFMTRRKLRNKYRSLWYAINTYFVSPSVGVSYGKGRDIDLSDLEDDISYELPANQVRWQNPTPRFQKIKAQITAMEDELESYVQEIASALIKHLRAEDDYLSSAEFAKDEAEAMEFKFTEDGDIYHG